MEESKIMEESIEMKVLLNPKILELESKIKKLDNEKENFVNKIVQIDNEKKELEEELKTEKKKTGTEHDDPTAAPEEQNQEASTGNDDTDHEHPTPQEQQADQNEKLYNLVKPKYEELISVAPQHSIIFICFLRKFLIEEVHLPKYLVDEFLWGTVHNWNDVIAFEKYEEGFDQSVATNLISKVLLLFHGPLLLQFICEEWGLSKLNYENKTKLESMKYFLVQNIKLKFKSFFYFFTSKRLLWHALLGVFPYGFTIFFKFSAKKYSVEEYMLKVNEAKEITEWFQIYDLFMCFIYMPAFLARIYFYFYIHYSSYSLDFMDGFFGLQRKL
uniref:Uncharacterized protein n=1 Tax=Panagrolaimus sp. JU765 TaxID=591449 RepID=A0AC34RDX8_9BILA